MGYLPIIEVDNILGEGASMLERIGGQIPIGPEFKGAAGGNITGVEAVETGSIEMKSLDDGMRMNSKEEVAEAVNSMNTFLKSRRTLT